MPILPRNQNAKVIAGLRCPPLRWPSGESTTAVPPPANNSPVANRRQGAEGMSSAITLPSDHMNTTAPMPMPIMMAVPKNSLR